MLLLLVSSLLLMIHPGQCIMEAVADVKLHGTSQSIGTLRFAQNDANSPVRITGALYSLNASSNLGFHVHTNGVVETVPNCTAAADHFNPYNTTHGPREANISRRHVGDLGNISTLANGTVVIYIEDRIIQLYNTTQSIKDRTIVVHAQSDDGGMGMGESNITGNAGLRVACGVIRLVSSNVFHIEPTMPALLLTITMTFETLFAVNTH